MDGVHTFTVEIDTARISARELERVDAAVENLKSLSYVTVTGWGDDED
jgi:hypothetical protein